MFELPECVNLAGQIKDELQGKTIKRGQLGNSPHKFVWYNRSHDEFEQLTRGKTIGAAHARGKWIFISLNPGYVLLLGEFGGKTLYHPPHVKLPKKYHLYLLFDDDTFLTVTTQMWGAMEIYEKGEEQQREYIVDMRPTPTDESFTLEYFNMLLDKLISDNKRSVKGLLTQDQLIPGLGNAIAQDILFLARLHPRHPISDLSRDQRKSLFESILLSVQSVTERGGRYDEFDLYNNRGGYIRLMDKNTLGCPCPNCGQAIEKIQYLGGTCYFCSNCQQ